MSIPSHARGWDPFFFHTQRSGARKQASAAAHCGVQRGRTVLPEEVVIGARGVWLARRRGRFRLPVWEGMLNGDVRRGGNVERIYLVLHY